MGTMFPYTAWPIIIPYVYILYFNIMENYKELSFIPFRFNFKQLVQLAE